MHLRKCDWWRMAMGIGKGRTPFVRRKMCTGARTMLVPHMDLDVKEAIERGEMTAKKHPGKVKIDTATLPDELVRGIKKIVAGNATKSLRTDVQLLRTSLWTRQLPAEKTDLQAKLNAQIAVTGDIFKGGTDGADDLTPSKRLQLRRSLNQRIQAWFPVNYTSYVGKLYMVGRMAAEYAALNKIFAEIKHTCPRFQPHSLFDFGSGVGTVSWVARKYWHESIQEYFCVDSSGEMNELAKLLLKGGDENAPLPFSGLYYRQFLSATLSSRYSLVVCSYSLFELPSAEIRLETLSKLWNKTEDFLVIVEPGTKHGFRLVNEARDFILQSDSENAHSTGVHVHSPCPHEFDCPMSKINEDPCRSHVSFLSPAIVTNAGYEREYFSYVVLRKGKRDSNDKQWPRVVTPPAKRRKHTHCHLCTKDGELHEIIFTKHRFGLTTYHCGRSLKQGDRLPAQITKTDVE